MCMQLLPSAIEGFIDYKRWVRGSPPTFQTRYPHERAHGIIQNYYQNERTTSYYCKYFFCFKSKTSGRKQMLVLFTMLTCVCTACTTGSQQLNQNQVLGLLTPGSPSKKAHLKDFPDMNGHFPRAEYLQMSLKPGLHLLNIPIWIIPNLLLHITSQFCTLNMLHFAKLRC